jgi:probable rRNA maturation factor
MIEVDFIDKLESVEHFVPVFQAFFKEIYDCLTDNDNFLFKTEKLEIVLKKGAVFELVFVDNDEIRELNKTYRKVNKITDVLSFEDFEYFEEKPFIGSVVISVERAKKQADEIGNSFKSECLFLSLHGFLHLLGFDHETDNGEMLRFQKQLKQCLADYFSEKS